MLATVALAKRAPQALKKPGGLSISIWDVLKAR